MNKQDKNLKIISGIGSGLSLLGLADSTYLTIAHYTTPTILACPETKFINCARVTTSQYSTFHGIPIVFFGLIFFVLMLGLQLPRLWKNNSLFIWRSRLALSILGLIAVFGLVYIELYKLHAICLYCTGVHVITFLVFVLTAIGSNLFGPNEQSSQRLKE